MAANTILMVRVIRELYAYPPLAPPDMPWSVRSGPLQAIDDDFARPSRRVHELIGLKLIRDRDERAGWQVLDADAAARHQPHRAAVGDSALFDRGDIERDLSQDSRRKHQR